MEIFYVYIWSPETIYKNRKCSVENFHLTIYENFEKIEIVSDTLKIELLKLESFYGFHKFQINLSKSLNIEFNEIKSIIYNCSDCLIYGFYFISNFTPLITNINYEFPLSSSSELITYYLNFYYEQSNKILKLFKYEYDIVISRYSPTSKYKQFIAENHLLIKALNIKSDFNLLNNVLVLVPLIWKNGIIANLEALNIYIDNLSKRVEFKSSKANLSSIFITLNSIIITVLGIIISVMFFIITPKSVKNLNSRIDTIQLKVDSLNRYNNLFYNKIIEKLDTVNIDERINYSKLRKEYFKQRNSIDSLVLIINKYINTNH